MLTLDTPRATGLDPARWDAALRLVRSWCAAGHIRSAGVIVGRHGKTTGAHLFGRQTLAADSPPVCEDAIFLIASVTKPIVGMGALILAERGLIALDDRV